VNERAALPFRFKGNGVRLIQINAGLARVTKLLALRGAQHVLEWGAASERSLLCCGSGSGSHDAFEGQNSWRSGRLPP
jgi:hypothetical protein